MNHLPTCATDVQTFRLCCWKDFRYFNTILQRVWIRRTSVPSWASSRRLRARSATTWISSSAALNRKLPFEGLLLKTLAARWDLLDRLHISVGWGGMGHELLVQVHQAWSLQLLLLLLSSWLSATYTWGLLHFQKIYLVKLSKFGNKI